MPAYEVRNLQEVEIGIQQKYGTVSLLIAQIKHAPNWISHNRLNQQPLVKEGQGTPRKKRKKNCLDSRATMIWLYMHVNTEITCIKNYNKMNWLYNRDSAELNEH